MRLLIYDRWGNKLFETNDQNAVWDGIYLGKACKEDRYVYKLEYEPYKGAHGEKMGQVNLIR